MDNVLTKDDLKMAFAQMGIRKGMLVFVQSSLRPFGWVVGGAQAIIDALMETVTYDGTIVMPAFTKNLSDPSMYKSGTVPRDSWYDIRQSSLPFNKRLSSPVNMGEVAVQFMRNDAVLRSNHPAYSFLAWGKYAKLVVEKHPLHFGLSKDSPLSKIVDLNGFVLLAGMNYDKCEMFDLAQYSNRNCPIRVLTYPVEKGGNVHWIKMLDKEISTNAYKAIGATMEERGVVKTLEVGNATCRFFSAREAINSATVYLNINN